MSSESNGDEFVNDDNDMPEFIASQIGESSSAVEKTDTFSDAVVSQHDLPRFETAREEAIVS